MNISFSSNYQTNVQVYLCFTTFYSQNNPGYSYIAMISTLRTCGAYLPHHMC